MVFFCEMVILVVFNSVNVSKVKNLKKRDPVARQMPTLYTTDNKLVCDKIPSGEKMYKRVMIICVMIIKLNHNTKCYQQEVRM